MNEPLGAGLPRYAIYFAPAPATAWWNFGAEWLGRGSVQYASPEGIAQDVWRRMTDEPRRYGFHATLKAPFRLARSIHADPLRQRLRQLAQGLRSIPLGTMRPMHLPGFVALVPATQPPGLDELAARCVSELDDLRAPLAPQEIQRRRPESLDDRGRELLLRYGYPHVLDRFRFHMTLAMCADDDLAAKAISLAERIVAPLNREHPLVLDRLCLFVERAPGAPFRRVGDFLLHC